MSVSVLFEPLRGLDEANGVRSKPGLIAPALRRIGACLLRRERKSAYLDFKAASFTYYDHAAISVCSGRLRHRYA